MQPSAPTPRLRFVAAGLALVSLLLVRCAGAPAASPNQEIVVCGHRFPIGTRVVLWDEPGGYDAYREGKFFADEPPDHERRYGERPGSPQTLDELRKTVHAFVLHYDACGTSRQCFKVLQDVRTLSVHFLLDVDGTIYQTLDLRERAWHATLANGFSVGVEIAHPGAWPHPLSADMRRWYARDEEGWFMKTPKWMTETGIRTPGFVARPARPDFVSGEVQGKMRYQFDYTPEQYEALAHLCAGLSRALPRIRLRAPRDASGAVVNHKIPDDELRAFDGIIGHLHVQTNKVDPGPAMQWDRLLTRAKQLSR